MWSGTQTRPAVGLIMCADLKCSYLQLFATCISRLGPVNPPHSRFIFLAKACTAAFLFPYYYLKVKDRGRGRYHTDCVVSVAEEVEMSPS